MPKPFRYFNSSPEVIRLTVMLYVRFPFSLRQVEIFFTSAALTFVMRPCGSGGTTSVRHLPLKSGSGGFITMPIPAGVGMSMPLAAGSLGGRQSRPNTRHATGEPPMSDDVQDLIDRLREIEDALESQFEARRKIFHYELKKKKAVFEASIVAQHREIKTGVLRFLKNAPILSLLTAPFIYGLIVPLVFLDLNVILFQWICFPVWGLSPVRRSDYLVIDRQYPAYLNGIQKLNCV
jgi:hypothetical protein